MPAPDGQPRYVLSLQPKTNTVVVGPGELLDADEIVAIAPVWTSGTVPATTFRCAVQLRAHGLVSEATITRVGRRGRPLVSTSRSAGLPPGRRSCSTTTDGVIGSATIASARRAGVTA